MFDKTGERQRVFLQHCKNIVVFLEDINRMEETLKMTWIIENAELLKSIGISILEVVKAFADMESYSLIRHLNHQNISWTDDVENACNIQHKRSVYVARIMYSSFHIPSNS